MACSYCKKIVWHWQKSFRVGVTPDDACVSNDKKGDTQGGRCHEECVLKNEPIDLQTIREKGYQII